MFLGSRAQIRRVKLIVLEKNKLFSIVLHGSDLEIRNNFISEPALCKFVAEYVANSVVSFN